MCVCGAKRQFQSQSSIAAISSGRKAAPSVRVSLAPFELQPYVHVASWARSQPSTYGASLASSSCVYIVSSCLSLLQLLLLLLLHLRTDDRLSFAHKHAYTSQAGACAHTYTNTHMQTKYLYLGVFEKCFQLWRPHCSEMLNEPAFCSSFQVVIVVQLQLLLSQLQLLMLLLLLRSIAYALPRCAMCAQADYCWLYDLI